MSWLPTVFAILMTVLLCQATRIALPRNLGLRTLAGSLICGFVFCLFAGFFLWEKTVLNWSTAVIHYELRYPGHIRYQAFIDAKDTFMVSVPIVLILIYLPRKSRMTSGGET